MSIPNPTLIFFLRSQRGNRCHQEDQEGLRVNPPWFHLDGSPFHTSSPAYPPSSSPPQPTQDIFARKRKEAEGLIGEKTFGSVCIQPCARGWDCGPLGDDDPSYSFRKRFFLFGFLGKDIIRSTPISDTQFLESWLPFIVVRGL
jgi:hypothetical protein